MVTNMMMWTIRPDMRLVLMSWRLSASPWPYREGTPT